MSLLLSTLNQVAKKHRKTSTNRPCFSREGYYTKKGEALRKQNRETVKAAFKEHGPLTSDAMADILGIEDVKSVRSIIGGLVMTKDAYRLDDGRYELTEKAHALGLVKAPSDASGPASA